MTTNTLNSRVDRAIALQLPKFSDMVADLQKSGADESITLDVAKAKLISGTLAYNKVLGINPGTSAYGYVVYLAGVIATDVTYVAYHKYQPVPEQLAALIARVSTPKKPQGKGLSSMGGDVLGQFAYKGGQAMGGFAQKAGNLAGSGLGASTSTIAKYLGKLGGYIS